MNIVMVEDQLDGFSGSACLVQDEDSGEFFVVSSLTHDESPMVLGDIETMAFRSDSQGNVLSWCEVAGGGDMTREDVINALTEDDTYIYYDEIELLDSAHVPFLEKSFIPVEEWEEWTREDETLEEYNYDDPSALTFEHNLAADDG